MTTNPTPVISKSELEEIEATAEALKGVSNACDISQAKPEFVNYILKCNPAAISALCQTVRALRANLDALRQQVEDTVLVAKTDEDADGFISAYHFQTGAIHRLLAEARKGD